MAVGMFETIREVLSSGPQTSAVLFERVEAAETPRQVSKALWQMKQKGQVERLEGPARSGRWALTEKGQRLAAQDVDVWDGVEPTLPATESEEEPAETAGNYAPNQGQCDEGEDLPVNPVRPLASPFREAVESAPERPFVRPLGEEVLEHASAAAAHMQMVLESYIEEHEDPLLREMLAACQRSEATLEALKAWLR